MYSNHTHTLAFKPTSVLCAAACLAEKASSAAGQSGHGCGCQRSRDVTAQGTPRKMSSSVCVCVFVEAIHRAIRPPNRPPFIPASPWPLASPQASRSPPRWGLRGCAEDRDRERERWGGTSQAIRPVTNPNPQSLTGQSLLSAALIPDCGHIEDIKQ